MQGDRSQPGLRAAALALAAVLALAGPASAASIADTAWLQGRWVGEGLGGQVEQAFSAPAGGQVVGYFRLAHDGKPAMYQIILVDEHEDGLRLLVRHFSPDFTAWEDKAQFLTFPFVSSAPGDLRFQGLAFRRDGADGLVITIRMRDGDGPATDREIRLRRAS